MTKGMVKMTNILLQCTHNENVWISDCMSRLLFIAGELHANGVTLHTDPAHHDTQKRDDIYMDS